MSEATIASPELTLLSDINLAASSAKLPEVGNGVSDHFGVDGVIPDESVIPEVATGKDPNESYQDYYIRLANQIQQNLNETGEEVPGITDMSPENLAKDLFLHDHPEVKAKMVEAAAMVNKYTNTVQLPNSDYPEVNLHAMDTAAQEVLSKAMNATSLEQIQNIKPEEAAATAILVHYYNIPEPDQSQIQVLAEDISEKWEKGGGHDINMTVAEKALSRKSSFGPDFKLEETSHAANLTPTVVSVATKAPVKSAGVTV